MTTSNDPIGRVPDLPDIAAVIDGRNQWTDETDEQRARNRRFEDAAELLATIALWFAPSKTLEAAGRRAICLVHVLRPRALFDRPSYEALASKFGGTKQSYSKCAAELFRLSQNLFETPLIHGQKIRAASRRRALKQHREHPGFIHARRKNERHGK